MSECDMNEGQDENFKGEDDQVPGLKQDESPEVSSDDGVEEPVD